MMKFFYAPGSCALAVHIALEEAGAAFEPIKVDFAAGEQRQPAYLALNPKGRVPLLVTDRGALTEAFGILLYIAQTHPAAKLAPLDDPFALAQVQAFNGYLASTVHVAHAHGRRGTRWADDPAAVAEMKRKMPEVMTDCFGLIEREMFKGPWVMGTDYTICDPYLYTIATWLEGDTVDPRQFPKVFDHRNRMADRPAVKRALAREAGK